MQADCQIGLLSPHFPTYLASWRVSRPGSKRATEGLKWAFSWVDSGGPRGYLAHCIHGNHLLPAMNPVSAIGPTGQGCSRRGSNGQLSAGLLHTGHQSHTGVHGQTSAIGVREELKQLFLNCLDYLILFESFPTCLSAILKTKLGKWLLF